MSLLQSSAKNANPLMMSAASSDQLHTCSSNIRIKKRSLPSEHIEQLVRDNCATHKLVLSTCKSVAREHMLLRYDFECEKFEVMALAPFLVNGQVIDQSNGFITLKALD